MVCRIQITPYCPTFSQPPARNSFPRGMRQPKVVGWWRSRVVASMCCTVDGDLGRRALHRNVGRVRGSATRCGTAALQAKNGRSRLVLDLAGACSCSTQSFFQASVSKRRHSGLCSETYDSSGRQHCFLFRAFSNAHPLIPSPITLLPEDTKQWAVAGPNEATNPPGEQGLEGSMAIMKKSGPETGRIRTVLFRSSTDTR